MVQQSDQQLVRTALLKLPWFTVGVLVLQFACFVASNLSTTESSFFSLQAVDFAQLERWGFDLGNPLRTAGLTLVTSFFIHSGWEHFLSNMGMAFMILVLAERTFGKSRICLYLLVGHLCGLLGASLAHRFLSQPPLVMGMSAGIFTVAANLLSARFGKTAWSIAGVFGLIYVFVDPAGFTAHALAILVGLAGLPFMSQKSPA
ncbi:MAG: rhomboid family intramembrane serine protease [Silvanigrellaceae bacterium]